ncbi:hypothetical protein AVEN_131195-1 [Araneus ventricosus]|uniref:Uncharacterized protein n=1 Tax=Araneus ventricosus TaxID=182803 RepID=A0A4Y2Q1D9_ARAVE|nr:hypothetical protein AVEN_8052-1 [Araneus ventricosus]GBN57224.1 hypothetical protein AVEN_232095-1 [Araneus ventricosus]GBN57393.1 hypothetical protein AVEN_131195-1 [Araneus ventricosus]
MKGVRRRLFDSLGEFPPKRALTRCFVFRRALIERERRASSKACLCIDGEMFKRIVIAKRRLNTANTEGTYAPATTFAQPSFALFLLSIMKFILLTWRQ